MARKPHLKFMASIVATAVAITLISNSAQALDRREERALAALFGLAVLGAILADDDRSSEPNVQVRRKPSHGGVQARPLPDRVRQKQAGGGLPAHCVRYVGDRRYFGARCLARNYTHADKLPNHCLRQVRTERGLRTFWGKRCLAKQGFRVARH